MIVDDYVDTCNTYRSKYGQRTVVLYQIGDFFELNSYPGEDGEIIGADIHRIADICNLQVTRKNKAVLDVTKSNCWMAGFPMAALSKYTGVLLTNGYTIVIVRQVTPPPNVRREVTEVLSPSTQLNPGQRESNFLMSLVLDGCTDRVTGKRTLSLGMAATDVSTGQVVVYETYGTLEVINDEIVRLVGAYAPKEITVSQTQNFYEKVTLEVAMRHDREWINEFERPNYQNTVFSKTWGDAMLEPIEHLGLERLTIARVALVMLLQFAYEHNERIIEKLDKPRILLSDVLLTLEYNSAQQLQLVGGDGERPLMTLLNRCATAFGARLFRERLMSPIRNAHTLQHRYHRIQYMLDKYAPIHKTLGRMYDMERMNRRIALGTFHPADWPSFHETIEAARCVLEDTDDINTLDEIGRRYVDIIDLEEASKYLIGDIRGSIFRVGVFPDVDMVAQAAQEALDYLRWVQSDIASYEPCQIDNNERDGYHIIITKKRWESVTSKASKNTVVGDITLSELQVRPVSNVGSGLRVTHQRIIEASGKIIESQMLLTRLVTDKYKNWMSQFSAATHEHVAHICGVIAELDVVATCAKNAVEYKYVAPRLCNKTDTAAVSMSGMRHPIIERIHDRLSYVTNDVCLGQEQCGMLLYGINASGKSSYMKAVGLNIIMAQAGMFVAADDMELAPYHHLFTRIQGNDNVYRGMSTFTVEMTELRNILQRADAFSLVLGDELCAGTEAISGTAIVAAGVDMLMGRRSSFVFATHLHELVDIPMIKDNSNLQITHMHVEIDANRTLVYDRKLRPGSGNPVYGLEVCTALGMPDDFLALAQKVRRYIQKRGEFLIDPQSKCSYNNKLFVDVCGVCGAQASEVHHIHYQKHGGDNRQSNLIPLCSKCHDAEHHGHLHIEGYQHTSNGRRVVHTTESLKGRIKYDVGGWFVKRTEKGRWRAVDSTAVREYAKSIAGYDVEMAELQCLSMRNFDKA